jgi:hypothetical protein
MQYSQGASCVLRIAAAKTTKDSSRFSDVPAKTQNIATISNTSTER